MTKNQIIKAKVVDEIVERFKRAKSIVFVDYRGLNVSETTELRNKMRENNIDYKVYKNKLVSIALKKCNIDFEFPLESTLAVAISYVDEVKPAALLSELALKTNKSELKFGILNGKSMNQAAVKELANIPSKEILIAKLLYCIKSPLTKLAIALTEIAKKQA